MSEEVEAYFIRARAALSDARFLAGDGRVEGAISRAYYAAYYAARGALLRVGETPRTHVGTQTRFAFRFVATGLLPRERAEVLGYAFDARQKADYEAFSVYDDTAAGDLLDDVESFVSTVERMVREGGSEDVFSP